MGITLSKKKLSKGRFSLYLDCCINGKRRKEYLGIILEAPINKEIRKINREKIQLAQLLRSRKEMEYLQSRYLNQFIPAINEEKLTDDENSDFFIF